MLAILWMDEVMHFKFCVLIDKVKLFVFASEIYSQRMWLASSDQMLKCRTLCICTCLSAGAKLEAAWWCRYLWSRKMQCAFTSHISLGTCSSPAMSGTSNTLADILFHSTRHTHAGSGLKLSQRSFNSIDHTADKTWPMEAVASYTHDQR